MLACSTFTGGHSPEVATGAGLSNSSNSRKVPWSNQIIITTIIIMMIIYRENSDRNEDNF